MRRSDASGDDVTRNVKAWELILLATDLQHSYLQQNALNARTMIQQAIELDPNYAYARGMARSYRNDAGIRDRFLQNLEKVRLA